MKTLDEVEDLFVREVLDTHGEYMADLLTDAIEEKDLRVTDDLIESIDYGVDVIEKGKTYRLWISFLSYGRAIEIEYFKSKRTRREAKVKNDSGQLRRAKKKDTRFYAKNVYGSLNRLLGRLGSEYSEAEIKRLKGILENRI